MNLQDKSAAFHNLFRLHFGLIWSFVAFHFEQLLSKTLGLASKVPCAYPVVFHWFLCCYCHRVCLCLFVYGSCQLCRLPLFLLCLRMLFLKYHLQLHPKQQTKHTCIYNKSHISTTQIMPSSGIFSTVYL